MSIRVQDGCHCEYQGTGMGVTVSIRVHGSCHCEYQGLGMGVTVGGYMQTVGCEF